jgi:hypothetical protein
MMSEQSGQPSNASVSLDGIASVYSEIWRLDQLAAALVDRAQAAAARRIARQLRASLDVVGIETVDYVGRGYDAGMAPEVIDIQVVKALEPRGDIVSETLEPTIICHGQVLKRGQIVVRRSVVSAKSEDGGPNGRDD